MMAPIKVCCSSFSKIIISVTLTRFPLGFENRREFVLFCFTFAEAEASISISHSLIPLCNIRYPKGIFIKDDTLIEFQVVHQIAHVFSF